MNSSPHPLVLVLAGLLLIPNTASAQEVSRSRVTVATGYTLPVAGYYWGGSAPWTSTAHLHVAYEHMVTRSVRLGGGVSYDRQESGSLSVGMLTAAVRGGYGGLESRGFAFVPFVEAGVTAASYRSASEWIGGSSRLAPRVGFGVAIRQRVWRGLGIAGEAGHQFVLDRFDGFTQTIVLPPRGPETEPGPSFRYTEARLGVSWSF